MPHGDTSLRKGTYELVQVLDLARIDTGGALNQGCSFRKVQPLPALERNGNTLCANIQQPCGRSDKTPKVW